MGFIYSLRFTQEVSTSQPYFTKEEVDDYLDDLFGDENSLWDDEISDKIGVIAQEIADEFEFTIEEVINN